MDQRTRTLLVGAACGLVGGVLGVVLTLVWVDPGGGTYGGPSSLPGGVDGGPGRHPHRTEGHRSQEQAGGGADADTGGSDGLADGDPDQDGLDEEVEADEPTSELLEQGLRLGTGEWVPATRVGFDGQGHALTPSFSPDGRWLAFEVHRFVGDVDLFTLDTLGSGPALQVRLPGSQGGPGGLHQFLDPTWHPQGVLVFQGSETGARSRLYYATTSGLTAAQLMDLKTAPGELSFPVVSPDGQEVAFVSDHTGRGDIRSWNRTTGLTAFHTRTPEEERYPAWSPTGQDLAFSRRERGTEALYLVEPSGQERVLAGREGDQTRPAWVDEHTLLYFDGSRGQGAWDLRSVQRTGADTVLAQGVRLPERARPALSPDGRWVAWCLRDPDRDDAVWVRDLSSGREVELQVQGERVGEPALGQLEDRVLLAWTALPDASANWRELYFADVTDALVP